MTPQTPAPSTSWPPSFCIAPWLTATISITNGLTTSCDLIPPHSIDPSRLQLNPTALHNTDNKKALRTKMLQADQPEECQICWSCEKKDPTRLSPRQLENQKYNLDAYEPLATSTGQENVNLRQLKIQFTSDHTHSPTLAQVMLREAFWRWWPELSQTLSDLHITDSLSSRDLWALLDDLGDQGGSDKLGLTIEDHFHYSEDLSERCIEKTYYTQTLNVFVRLENLTQDHSLSPLSLPQWLNSIQKMLIHAKIKQTTIKLTQKNYAALVQTGSWPLILQLKEQFADQYLSFKIEDEQI